MFVLPAVENEQTGAKGESICKSGREKRKCEDRKVGEWGKLGSENILKAKLAESD